MLKIKYSNKIGSEIRSGFLLILSIVNAIKSRASYQFKYGGEPAKS